MKQIIDNVLSQYFDLNGVLKIETLHDGLINNSFKITTSFGDFVLQKINLQVFPNIEALLNNKIKISQYLIQKKFKTITYVANKNGLYYTKIAQDYWQLSNYIPSVTKERFSSKEMAQEVGRYLAKFHQVLLDFPISELQYTLPDFHHSIKRFVDFEGAISKANSKKIGRAHV